MKRRRLTPRERAALLSRQGGCCCVFGCVETRDLIEEHSTPFALKAGRADQLMCKAHHAVKTRADVKGIAKAKRLSGETSSQYSRRKQKGPQLKSRGFDKRLRKKMSGEVVRR